MTAPAASLVGLSYTPEPSEGVVVGRRVAVEGVLGALGLHARSHAFRLFCDPRRVRDIAAALAAYPRLEAVSRHELGAGLDRIAVWFEPQFDLRTTFAWRRRFAGRYPVTALHHSLSYKSLLHEAVLPLLMGRPRPADTLICTSRAARDALLRMIEHVAERVARDTGARLSFPGRTAVVPLGVDTGRFHPRDRAESRRRFGLPDHAFILLWVGRLSPIDKADLLPLVIAFEGFRRRRPEHNPLLVCAGSQRGGEAFGDALLGFAREAGMGDAVRLILDQKLLGESLPDLYAAADVFVSPVDNVQESFGLAPVEAMASGVPQIVSDWSGYRDTVVDGVTGFLAPTLWGEDTADLDAGAPLTDPAFDHLALASSTVVDVEAMLRDAERLMDAPDLRRRMAAASRERAEREYAWPRVVERYESLWAEAAAAPAPEAMDAAPSFEVPDYHRFFGHYASRSLAPEAELQLTERGRGLIAGAGLPTHYNAAWGYLDLSLVQRILAGLEKSRLAGKPLGTGRILAVLAGDARVARAGVRRHLLWLLKYGYVREVGP